MKRSTAIILALIFSVLGHLSLLRMPWLPRSIVVALATGFFLCAVDRCIHSRRQT